VNLRTLSTLQVALGTSIAVHAALLGLRFADPQTFNRVFQDTPLEVILVNARSNERPEKAQAIAQANLAGGGDVEKGRATSPLPPSHVTFNGKDTEHDQQRQLKDMQEQQNLILAQIKTTLANLPPSKPQDEQKNPEQAQLDQKRRQLTQLLAEIEKRINAENARPKKRYISPATQEAVYAVYYDHLRRTIEDKGTENFPQSKGKKLYGELTMVITINHDGHVLSTEVVQSSGKPVLDRRASSIASSAGPFGAFSPAMRQQADQIAVVSRFKFTRDETLQTSLSNN
jgi:protein TonB